MTIFYRIRNYFQFIKYFLCTSGVHDLQFDLKYMFDDIQIIVHIIKKMQWFRNIYQFLKKTINCNLI